MSSSAESAFKKFVEIIARLRDPNGGCPWDLQQNHQTIRPYLLEETYEVLEAIEQGDDTELMQELGDLLLQVALHSQIAADRQAFNITDVVNCVADKMVTRHPHVFGTTKVENTAEVLKNWEQIKRDERKQAGDKSNPLSGIPKAMPALVRAARIGEKAAKSNFDWDNVNGVLNKVREEIAELEEVLPANLADSPNIDKQKVEHELGDLLFALAQLARWLEINPEDALHRTSKRFIERFAKMEELRPGPWHDLEEAKLEELWQTAKRAISRG